MLSCILSAISKIAEPVWFTMPNQMLKYVEQCNGNIADIITACIRLELCQSELFVACCWKKLHDPVCPISPGTVILVLSSSVLSGLYFHGLLQVRRGHQSSSEEESSGIASAAFFTGRHPARCSSCHNQQCQSTEALTTFTYYPSYCCYCSLLCFCFNL